MTLKPKSLTNRGFVAFRRLAQMLAIGLAAGAVTPVSAQQNLPQSAGSSVSAPVATYADLVDLTQESSFIALVEVTKQSAVPADRAPGLAPGHVRLYLQTTLHGLLLGPPAVGATQSFLVDVPADRRGRAPKLRKHRFLIFADPVSGNSSQLQLVQPGSMFASDPVLEQRTRGVIGELAARPAPPVITGVRDAFSMTGNLAGESETQLFLDTKDGSPVSMTVIRRPGMQPQWGVSWTEIVDQSAVAPQKDTLAWYRLACSLGPQLPAGAVSQEDRSARMQAEADYLFVIGQLGPCERIRS